MSKVDQIVQITKMDSIAAGKALIEAKGDVQIAIERIFNLQSM